MRLKEIIIDGFKSYANRTVISGFDKSFNAITGLNGSGKSNILDSICFVLGITNLSSVRCNNIMELIYKSGQSRVTKATVSLVFDNSIPTQSPMGFENCSEITITRQIQVGGKNKYLINGHSAQQQRVATLFHSVQLNINNPHFVIMQGRITKVVNMKPEELLSLIEEAAGTKLFEVKKLSAIKTIQKKQSKVDEINDLLRTSIQPTLEKLRGERKIYYEWQNKKNSVERMEKILQAIMVKESNEENIRMEKEINKMKNEISLRETQMSLMSAKLVEMEEEIIKAKERREKGKGKGKDESSSSSSSPSLLSQYESQLNTLGRQLVKLTTQLDNVRENIKVEGKANEKMVKTIAEMTKSMDSLDKKIQSTGELNAKDGKEKENLQNEIQSISSQLLGFQQQSSSSSSSSSTSSGGFQGELISLKSSVSSLKSELKLLEKQRKEIEKSRNDEEKKSSLMNSEFKKRENDILSHQMELNNLSESLTSLSSQYSKSQLEQMKSDLQKLKTSVSDTRNELNSIGIKLSRYDIPIDASLSFMKSGHPHKVKGIVAKLIQISETKFARAIEVVGGGKLFHLVVENEMIGKEILESGKLNKRITIIPLNKIQNPRMINEEMKDKTAEIVGPQSASSVHSAIDLLSYDTNLLPAIQFVFGSTFIVENPSHAALISFNPQIRMRSVTLDGDVIDPSGTMEGGATDQKSSVLLLFQQFNSLSDKRVKDESEIKRIEKSILSLEEKEKTYLSQQEKMELLQHKMTLMKEEMKGSAFETSKTKISQWSEKLLSMDSERKEKEEKMNEMEKVRIPSLEMKIAKLESEEKMGKKALESLENDLSELKKKLKNIEMKTDEKENQIKKYQIQKDEILTERKKEEDKLGKMTENIAKYTEEQSTLLTELSALQSQHEDINSKLSLEKRRDAEESLRIQKILDEKSTVQKEIADSQVETKKIQTKLGKMEGEKEGIKERIQRILQQNSWIKVNDIEENSETFMGIPMDPKERVLLSSSSEINKKLASLREESDEISGRLNKKVVGMIEKAESEYEELIKKRQIVQDDKAKIEFVIHQLDKKKQETLEMTWKKVTKDLGSIMGTLLPGCNAKLDPHWDDAKQSDQNGGKLIGLTLKIAFNGQWKTSLTELSGGQRSLLALSLILSLLLFKPAPLYILDEIDAALDLNHTQNIGQMLKLHFPQSQFIVVSLKEGMFNNANVLFRTKFVDGISTVIRQMGGTASVNNQSASSSASSDSGKGKKSKNLLLNAADDEAEKENVNNHQEQNE